MTDYPSKPAMVLASSSIYRRQLLEKLGLQFECKSPDIDESPLAEETPEQLTIRLAENKAQALAQAFPNHLIIGSDQVASCDGTILTKPGNHDNAVKQLSLCSGKSVTFYTGLYLLNTRSGQAQLGCIPFTVNFRSLSTGQIENYLLAEKPYDCAGSFKSEGLGICLFESMEGSDPNSLIGLPLIELCNMLSNEDSFPLD